MTYINSFISNFRAPSVKTEPDNIVMISGMPEEKMRAFFSSFYGTHAFFDRFFKEESFGKYSIPEFFIPEFVYLLFKGLEQGYLSGYRVNILVKQLHENTWYGGMDTVYPSKLDLRQLDKEINPNFKPTKVQMEFLTDIYWQKKTQMHLRGYLNAMEPGMGKSKLALFLTACLKKKHAIVIAPHSTIHNVWKNEIVETFKYEKTIWTPSEFPNAITKKTDFVIVNYEQVGKITDRIMSQFLPEETIIIIDESHNYKDSESKRSQELFYLTDNFACGDILPMSGTPLKAFGLELTYLFRILDPFFTKEAYTRLKLLSKFTSVMNDLMRNRLGMIMFRRFKNETMQLPPKHEDYLKVKIPNGNDFTIEEVKKGMLEFKAEREAHYATVMDDIVKDFEECLNIYQGTIYTREDLADLATYKTNVQMLKEHGIVPETREIASWTSNFEKNKILPALPSEKRKVFNSAKSAVKYLQLKILGEVLGQFLGRKRIEMTSALIGDEVMKVIATADKKTILFTSYGDTIKIADDRCKKVGFRPMCIDGSNSKDAVRLLKEFRSSEYINPLIASINVLSTGHTINEANTVIFLNVPFRSVDYEQASNRCYRIGQDAEVFIYKLVLDTGDEPNLSTRMHDIIDWSKEQFDSIMGDDQLKNMQSFSKEPLTDILERIGGILSQIKIKI